MTDFSIRELTLDEFSRHYESEGAFEIIDGDIIAMSPTLMGHNNIAANLMWLFQNHIKPRQLGVVYAEAPFVIMDVSDWVKGARVPDVMFITQERFAAYTAAHPDWEAKPLILVPDLVVEIISKNDLYSAVDAKVQRYLEDGVKVVLVVDPQRKKVALHEGQQQTNLTYSDTLTLAPLLPEFSTPVSAIFA